MSNKTKRRLSTTRVHWYMAAVSVDYLEPELDDNQALTGRTFKRTQTLNVIIQQDQRLVVAGSMEAVRELTIQRMVNQFKMSPDKLVEFTVMNMIYMGHMSEHTYFTTGQEKPANG